jgi:hypothetical protein
LNNEIVVLRKYGDEFSAQLDAAVLEANGVPAQVSADTAGGAYPSLAMLNPVRLLVHAQDAALAAEILDAAPADPPAEEDDPSA